MQIELFPEDKSPLAMDGTILKGKIGPIRFAVTPTSYPLLCRTLAALTATKECPDDETDP